MDSGEEDCILPQDRVHWKDHLAKILRRFTSVRGRERICKYKFSKVNALRKDKSEDCSQEEISVRFSQTEWNGKAVLVALKSSLVMLGKVKDMCSPRSGHSTSKYIL